MNKTMKQKIDNSSGFTLIEVLIAAVIVAFGSLAMGAFLGNLITHNSANERKTMATILAQDKIEGLRNQALNNNLTSADDSTDTVTTAAGPFTRTWAIDDSSNPNQITVQVTWNGVVGDTQVTLVTLIND
jgi:prepilin-type N-terminal cleavage/methylation domain-containing protein